MSIIEIKKVVIFRILYYLRFSFDQFFQTWSSKYLIIVKSFFLSKGNLIYSNINDWIHPESRSDEVSSMVYLGHPYSRGITSPCTPVIFPVLWKDPRWDYTVKSHSSNLSVHWIGNAARAKGFRFQNTCPFVRDGETSSSVARTDFTLRSRTKATLKIIIHRSQTKYRHVSCCRRFFCTCFISWSIFREYYRLKRYYYSLNK